MNPPVDAPASRQQPIGRVEPERVERVRELLPAARDEPRLVGHLDRDVVGNHLAGLVGGPALVAQANIAREDGGRGASAGLEETALGQDGIEPLA